MESEKIKPKKKKKKKSGLESPGDGVGNKSDGTDL